MVRARVSFVIIGLDLLKTLAPHKSYFHALWNIPRHASLFAWHG